MVPSMGMLTNGSTRSKPVLSKKQGFVLRLTATRLVLLVIFALLVSRLWYLQIVEGARFREAADVNRVRTVPTAPLRGRIFDRDGNILAENVPSFAVMANAQDLPESEPARTAMFDRLCTLLQCPGTLLVDPLTISSETWDRLWPWLSRQVDLPPNQMDEPLAALQQTFSLTLHLDEQTAGWLREQVSTTAGLTYTTSLEQALQENPVPPYLAVTLAENVPRDCALALEEHRLEFPGIFVQAVPLRRYPTGESTAHVVGYIGRISPEELVEQNPDPDSGQSPRYLENDHIGKMGAERAYEDILRGKLGLQEIEVDASGHPVGAPLAVQAAQPGYDVVMTLDSDLQAKVTEILQYYVNKANSQRPGYYRPVYAGSAIAMDPRNGQILAMVSLPAYDNNAFVQGMTTEELSALFADPHHPLVNRAISGEYPVGSTFKVVVGSAGLQAGVITPETLIYDRGAVVVPNRYDPSLPPQIFPCWKRGGHGRLNVVRALQVSCNVFFFTVAGGTPENKYEDGLGIERLAYYAHAFGYGVPTGLGFPGESEGLIPTPEWKEETLGEPWVQGDLYNMGIGQGNILATPLQAIGVMAAVANGGTRYRPQLLLRALDSQGQVVLEFTPQVEQVVPVDPAYLAVIREGLRKSVAEGPNYYARDHSSVAIAGKTGSAEFGPFLQPNSRQTHAWFVAFAPYEDPQLAVVVMIEGGGDAATRAVPPATDIIEYYFTRPQGPASEEGYGRNDSSQR
jgi:penicillin-binding protein 2